ncbi:hypothetical protein [Clostridium sp. DL1XJH146]
MDYKNTADEQADNPAVHKKTERAQEQDKDSKIDKIVMVLMWLFLFPYMLISTIILTEKLSTKVKVTILFLMFLLFICIDLM